VDGVAFKKTFSYAGFEQQPKSFDQPKILVLNIELELKVGAGAGGGRGGGGGGPGAGRGRAGAPRTARLHPNTTLPPPCPQSEKENAEIRLEDPSQYQSIVDAEWNIIYDKLAKCAESGAQASRARGPQEGRRELGKGGVQEGRGKA
jgi:T-complex protein 1 subunit eta